MGQGEEARRAALCIRWVWRKQATPWPRQNHRPGEPDPTSGAATRSSKQMSGKAKIRRKGDGLLGADPEAARASRLAVVSIVPGVFTVAAEKISGTATISPGETSSSRRR